MRNLLTFLVKYSFFFLFLIFEIFCFYLIYNNSYYQNSSMLRATNSFTGSMHKSFDNVSQYLGLRKENLRLAEENAQLRSYYQLDSITLPDTVEYLLPDTMIHCLNARVVSNSVQRRNNYFMIDKGSRHGLSVDMGVVNPDGVVGIITGVSDNFASGMSVLHKNSRISAKILKNNQLVNVSWQGINYREGLIEDIPTHIVLMPGDTVITSGNSHIFPEGIMIGTVINFQPSPDQLFNTARILFATDFTSLNYVYIIENKYIEEIINLQIQAQGE